GYGALNALKSKPSAPLPAAARPSPVPVAGIASSPRPAPPRTAAPGATAPPKGAPAKALAPASASKIPAPPVPVPAAAEPVEPARSAELPGAPAHSLLAELALLDRVRGAIGADPERAVRELDDYERASPAGQMASDALAL